MVRNHKWNKEDTIITLYFTKYGIKGLPVKDEKDLAEFVIGTTETSLVLQSLNIRYILGYDEGTLTDFSKLQEKVVDEYHGLSEDKLKNVVIDIIDKRDINGNIEKVKQIKKAKEVERKKKASQAELDEIFRKMGKDPSKMKRLVK